MIQRGKLTKRFLLGLNYGSYIVSNSFYQEGVPVYAGKISALHKRERQWRTIVAASVDQRLCNVFKTKEGAMKWMAQIFSAEK